MRATMAMISVLLVAPAAAQNSPEDECIITLTLTPSLHGVAMTFDLLFNDTGWMDLVTAIDTDQDGNITDTEAVAYEEASRHQVHFTEIPPERWVNLEVDVRESGYGGTAARGPVLAHVSTDLIGFVGPAGPREGRVVRESWDYLIPDPLDNYGELTTREHGRTVRVKWGPAAAEEAFSGVAVVETVVAIAPRGWLVDAGNVTGRTYEFPSGSAYIVEFVREDPLPPAGDRPIPGISMIAVSSVLGAMVLTRRR